MRPAWFTLLLCAACATNVAPPPRLAARAVLPPGHGQGDGRFTLPSRVVEAASGRVLSRAELLAALADVKVIYLAEHHPNPHHHAAQLELLAALFRQDPSLGVGLEMVKRPFQQVLEEYLGGALDLEGMAAGVEWEARWGYALELYAPIFEFARAHALPLYALNVEDELTRRVAEGGVESLSEIERSSLPDLDLAQETHRALLRPVFEAHHHQGDFERFYAAQVLWDETMAYELSRALSAPSAPRRVVVLAGDGHVRYGLGIPDRAARRGLKPFRTIHPLMASELEEALADAPGDYLWVMAADEGDLPGAAPAEPGEQASLDPAGAAPAAP